MKRTLCIALCTLVILTSVCRSQGIGHGIELRMTSKKLIEAEPGTIITGSFVISNRTGREIHLLESLELPTIPEGWQPVVEYERDIVLENGEETLRLITLLVPGECPAGKFEVVYSLVDPLDSQGLARESFAIIVLPVVKLEATVKKKPQIVMAGEEYDVSLRVDNKGNSKASLLLNAKTSPDYPVSIMPPGTDLEPGKSRIIEFRVSTDATIESKTNHILDIDVSAAVQGSQPVSLERSVFIEILPTIARAVELRHSLPTEATFSVVGNKNDAGFQVQYSGSGSLDEAGTRNIDFLFRGPDSRDQSVYGMRDEIKLHYSGHLVDLSLGDKLYGLSPLSERLVFGRGGEFRMTPGRFELGSFHMETRWDTPERRETGFFAGYGEKGRLGIRGNFLRKERAEGSTVDGYEADIYTVQAKFEPVPAFHLGLEYGYSYNRGDTESEDPANRVTIDGELFDRIWYTAENTYAAPRFSGYYSDVLYSNGTISSRLYRKLRGNVSYRLYEYNLDSDPEKSSAPREHSIRGTLSYPFYTGTSISLDYEMLEKRDELVPAEFDFEENIWRIGFGQSLSKFNIQTYAEKALFTDNIQKGATRDLERYSVYAYYRPSRGQSISFYTRIGHNSFYGTPDRTISMGLSAALRFLNRIGWSMSYQSNNVSSDNLPRQDHLLTTVDILLPKDHTIALKARWFDFEEIGREDYSFIASYTIPFTVPAMRKTSIGSLRGRVIDLDNDGIPSDRRMLVTAGDHIAATDRNGEYEFPSIEPGTYSLQIDRRTFGPNKMPSEPLPLTVEVEGGKTAYREIDITTSCSITGTIALFVPPPGGLRKNDIQNPGGDIFMLGSGDMRVGEFHKDDFVEAYGLDRVMVEISNGKETLRRRTNAEGFFAFKGIRPGSWTIKVCDEGLPSFYYSEQDLYEIIVAPGEAHDLKIRVLPHRRSIQIIE